MKKVIAILPIFIAVFFMSFNGCDEFESLPLNVPIEIEFTVSGGNDTFDSGSFCLDTQSDEYQDIQDKIKDLDFVEAAFRCISISNPNATADLNVQIFAPPTSGSPLLNITINNFKPGDYTVKPFTLSFSQAQIEALNTYLNNLNNKCIRAVVVLSGLDGSVTVSGAIDIVLRAETEL